MTEGVERSFRSRSIEIKISHLSSEVMHLLQALVGGQDGHIWRSVHVKKKLRLHASHSLENARSGEARQKLVGEVNDVDEQSGQVVEASSAMHDRSREIVLKLHQRRSLQNRRVRQMLKRG